MKLYNFCTLFDTYYLTRGLALYESLQKHCDNFHLYIFAFDDNTYSVLHEQKFENVTIISLQEFENERLLSVKNDRTVAEYCWTSTGSTIKYCIKTFALDHCTYLDADLYFFGSPKILLDEVSDGNVLITEHRYTKKYDQSKSSGKYCVQFMTFHNSDKNMIVLNDWIDDCINWCYAKAEDGKFGDQKYLDSWILKYKNVHELKHLGGGVAPWNIQQYDIKAKKKKLVLKEKKSNISFDIVFYHFHALKFLDNNLVNLAPYSLEKEVVDLIYKPYITHLYLLDRKYIKNQQFNQINKQKLTLRYIMKRMMDDKGLLLRVFKQKILDNSNVYKIQDVMEAKDGICY